MQAMITTAIPPSQIIGRTQEACSRRMNALFAAKDLGVYDGKYADTAPTDAAQAA